MFPQTMTTGSPCRTSVSASISEKRVAPSPSSRTTCAAGRADPSGDGVAEAGTQAAERSGIEPPPGRSGSTYLPANENEVAAVADDHRVVVEHLEQLAVDTGRVYRSASLASSGPSAASAARVASASPGTHSGSACPPVGPPAAASAVKNAARSPDAEAASGTCLAIPPGASATCTTRAGASFGPNEPYPSLKSSGVPATITRSASRDAAGLAG